VRGAEAPRAVFDRATQSSPIALSRDNRLVWVVNPRDDTVTVLRTDTDTVLATIGVGDEPQSVALDPDNKFAYVANAADSTVTVIRITNDSFANFAAAAQKTLVTGAEPWNIVSSPDGKRVFVANSGQDTITVIDAGNRTIIGQVDLRDSLCSNPDRDRHFQPRGLAVTADNERLYVTRFISFTATKDGRQGRDDGKEGAVCRLDINTNAGQIGGYRPAELIRLRARKTGFATIDSNGDGVPDESTAFPNQLQSIVIRGGRAYLPNIAASPEGPLQFQNSTEAFVNVILGVNGGEQSDGGAINLHLGARDPEPGKTRLFFANPWAIAFTTEGGEAGNAYVVSAGSDLLVKLDVAANGDLSFTVDGDTTRYIDLNDPEKAATSGFNAGKNPQGIVITDNGNKAYVANFVSGNVSVVNLNQDKVVEVVQTANFQNEAVAVGAEMFFSSRGSFDRPANADADISTVQRLSQDGWQACSSCHFKGLTDGVIWAFGTGPRKSVNLAGTFNPEDRSEQKILNYSGIFDEIEDFEDNIRNTSGPGALAAAIACRLPPPSVSTLDPNHGLLIGDNGNINFPPCVNDRFNPPNAGREQVTVTLPGSPDAVPALTALRQWVRLAVRVPNGPLDSSEIAGGVPVDDIQAGRALFRDQQCTNCHGGGLWSSSVKDFVSPPANNQIACEVDLGAAALPGSFCTKAPEFGNPAGVPYLRRFLEDVGSFNLGVPGQGNAIGNNVGADEKAAPAIVAGVSQPPKDALGLDYNDDGRGEGFNPQSLLGIHAVQPYMHNGACETLACVVGDRNHRTANGTLPDRLNTAAKRALVVRFLESIDADTRPFN
jgi:YVTN family beta-propeller protein